jgi:hypothetical protein
MANIFNRIEVSNRANAIIIPALLQLNGTELNWIELKN